MKDKFSFDRINLKVLEKIGIERNKTVKNILVHGLGQNENSWINVEKELRKYNIDVKTPNLYAMLKNSLIDYNTLFKNFSDYCNNFDKQINLCGLSLGGLLALDYTKKFPNKVNSIIIIGVPYKIPKFIFKIQCLIFHIMPKSTFRDIGLNKADFISLVNSMNSLEINSMLDKIKCKTLIMFGDNDNQNMRSAKLFNKAIKNSCLKIIKNSSHEVNVDNQKDLSYAILNFGNK